MAKHDSYALTVSDVDTIMSNADAIIRSMRQATDRHYSAIMSELDKFDLLSPLDRVRHAIVFSIISPKCKIEVNTVVTPRMVELIMNGGTRDDIRAMLLAHGIGLQNVKSARLFNNSEFLRSMTSADVTRAKLFALDGISFKTSSMTLALYNQHEHVYTLDTHMYRWMRETAGLPRAMGTHHASDARYKKLESWLVSLAQEHCNDAPIFLTQWAVWNHAGFNDVHQCHLPIFGIVD